MKTYQLSLFVFLFVWMSNLTTQAQVPTDLTLLDDFSDGNYTANPVWTPADGSGTWTIASPFSRPNVVETNMSATSNTNFFSALSTPFSKVCNAWQIDMVVNGCSTSGRKVEYYFLMTGASSNPRRATGYKLSYHLNVLDGTTRRQFLYLQKVVDGVASNPPILAYNNGTFCGLDKVTLTYEGGLWKLYVGSTLRASGTDNTYSPSETAYQGLAVVDSIPSNFTDRYSFDNIKFREDVQTSIGGAGLAFSALQVQTFPNPAQDILQIRVQSPKSDRGEIRLLDLQGKILYNQSVFVGSGMSRYDISLSDKKIPSGMYLLELRTGSQQKQTKILVH